MEQKPRQRKSLIPALGLTPKSRYKKIHDFDRFVIFREINTLRLQDPGGGYRVIWLVVVDKIRNFFLASPIGDSE